jgi:hypothetical protein
MLKVAPSGSGKAAIPCSCMHAVNRLSAAVTRGGEAARLMCAAVLGAGVAVLADPLDGCAELAVCPALCLSAPSEARSTGRQAACARWRTRRSAAEVAEVRGAGIWVPCSRMHFSHRLTACCNAPRLACEVADAPPWVDPLVVEVCVEEPVADADPDWLPLPLELPPQAASETLASISPIAIRARVAARVAAFLRGRAAATLMSLDHDDIARRTCTSLLVHLKLPSLPELEPSCEAKEGA